MASRKPKPSSRAAPEQPQAPFNNPFVAVLDELRDGLPLRSPRAQSPSPRTAAGTPRVGPRSNRSAAPAGAPAADDDGAFLAAASGVVPIDHSSDRVTVRHRPDLEGISSVRDEDLRAMADLEGFDIRFSDQYIRGRCSGVSRETLAKLERGEFALRAHLDLHGMVVEDAMRAVDAFLADRQRRGDRCVILITGKGRNSRDQVGVLRSKIPEWLAKGPSARRVLAFVTARECDGGEGAVYVLLRRQPSRKNRIEVETGGVG